MDPSTGISPYRESQPYVKLTGTGRERFFFADQAIALHWMPRVRLRGPNLKIFDDRTHVQIRFDEGDVALFVT